MGSEGAAMTVHVGRLTSEVNAVGGDRIPGGGDEEQVTPTEEQRRIVAAVNRAQCRSLRTATGYGDD